MAMGLFDLSGKVALVTGSSRGLGYTIARGLAEAGATVVLNGRDAGRLNAAADALQRMGHDVHPRGFDVRDADAVSAAVAAIENGVGPVDILVNNAGIHRRAPVTEMTEAAWREVIDTNLTSAFLVSQCVGRGMLERRRGKIICVCSLMSEVGRPTIANYAASKGGLRMLVRSLTVEWADHNIQVNGIGPGYFRTDMTETLFNDPDFHARICGRTPAARWGQPDELIGASVFLAADASSYVNGQILYVDGGLLAAV